MQTMMRAYSSSNMGSYNSVPLSIEEAGHSSVRPIEFTDEESLSFELREVLVDKTGASGNTIVGRREIGSNSDPSYTKKPVCQKSICIIYGVLAGASAGAWLCAAAAFAGDKEIAKVVPAINAACTRSISLKLKPIFSIAVICYAAITGNTNALWGIRIGAGIGGIVGGYYGAKENEPREALTIADKKVSDFMSGIAVKIFNFVKAWKAPVEAEQSPKTV